MKKTILALVLAGSSAAVCAQDTTSTNMNNMNNNVDSAQRMSGNQSSTGNYNAYSNMPTTIQRNFQAQYPGATGAQWQQMYNGFWRATYRQNGQLTTVNYAPNGESFTIATPVLQSNVPQDIIARALDLYGNNVYDISLVKLPNPQLAAMDSAIAAASMNPANATMIGNAGVTGTDSSSMNNTTGDSSAMGVTANAPHTFWGVDTTGRAAMSRTIDLYMVRIIDNGLLRAQRMNADGSPDLSYGTTMASPMPSNMNMSNNMNQNLTTTNVNMTTSTPTYSDYYNGAAVSGRMDSTGANVNTGNYAAKDSAATTQPMDSTANRPMMDSTANRPMTDSTANRPMTDSTATTPVTDSTGTSPMTDSTGNKPSTDSTSGSSSMNATGNMNTTNNTNATQISNESGNAATSTSTDMNNTTNTNKKNKKNKKAKSTDSTNATGTNGTSGY